LYLFVSIYFAVFTDLYCFFINFIGLLSYCVYTIVTAHMQKKLITLSILFISMGLFSFSKKDKIQEKTSTSAILGMVLLEEAHPLDINKIVSELEAQWSLTAKKESESTGETAIIEIDEYRIAIGLIEAPIPTDEAIIAAQYNFFWKNGVDAVKKHKAHLILSVMNAGQNSIEENILFSKVASTVLSNSKSIGIYIGARSLAIEKDFYVASVKNMSTDDLPLYIWIYFGLRGENEKQSVYTYGLKDFGKKEMEILNSNKDHGELSDLMYNLSHYVIAQNVELKDGETIGFSTEQKLKISESKGVFLDGTTLKIEY